MSVFSEMRVQHGAHSSPPSLLLPCCSKVTIGLKFKSSRAGEIGAIRYFRAQQEGDFKQVRAWRAWTFFGDACPRVTVWWQYWV